MYLICIPKSTTITVISPQIFALRSTYLIYSCLHTSLLIPIVKTSMTFFIRYGYNAIFHQFINVIEKAIFQKWLLLPSCSYNFGNLYKLEGIVNDKKIK